MNVIPSLFAVGLLLQGLDERGLRHTAPLGEHIRLSLSSDRDEYYRGEVLQLQVTAENISTVPVAAYLTLQARLGFLKVFYRHVGAGDAPFAELRSLVETGVDFGRPEERTLAPGAKYGSKTEISLAELNPPNRRFVLDALGRYEFKVHYKDTPIDPYGVLESDILTVSVVGAPSSEQAAQAAYTVDLAYVTQFQWDWSFLSPEETHAAADFIQRFPESRYAQSVRKGLRRSLDYRQRKGVATDEERALWRQLFADHTPPVLTVLPSPLWLWPPNHRLIPVSVTVNVKDDHDPNPAIKLVSITCDDQCNPTVDIGNAAFDTDDRLFELRSERLGTGAGRTYAITYSAEDASGNKAVTTTTVVVPHDQGGGGGGASAWRTGVNYKAGDLTTHDGFTWKCIQANRSQSDWAPPRVPALWVKIPKGKEWDHPVQYAVGAEVTYQGATYTCRQAHTSQAGWTPPNTPALWSRK